MVYLIMKKENKITYCKCKRPFRWKWYVGGKEVCAKCLEYILNPAPIGFINKKVPTWQDE